jgi:hypothetical protein
MIAITNPKVEGFIPRWAPFCGFSILFDNPGESLTRAGQQFVVSCDVDADPALGFYRGLRDNLAGLGGDWLTNSYLFCHLPPPSYHVTLWDGGNDGNVAAMLPEQRHKLEALLAGLPEAMAPSSELIARAAASPLADGSVGEIRFRYDRLFNWGDVVLVALLAAADVESAAILVTLVEERRRLSADFRATYGIGPSDEYRPHVSLGYFANRELAQRAHPSVAEWDRTFAEQMAGQVLAFSGASVYGFTDMATFFKPAQG